jgi:hypothetical protein
MSISIFSVSYFENEIQVNIMINKTAEEAYLAIPSHIFTDISWNTYGKQEIFNNIKGLLVGESFRIAWNGNTHKYILITKTAMSSNKLTDVHTYESSDDDIVVNIHDESTDNIIEDVINNPSVIYRNLKIKLPPSPDLEDKDKDKDNYPVLCVRYIINISNWVKKIIMNGFEEYIFSFK